MSEVDTKQRQKAKTARATRTELISEPFNNSNDRIVRPVGVDHQQRMNTNRACGCSAGDTNDMQGPSLEVEYSG